MNTVVIKIKGLLYYVLPSLVMDLLKYYKEFIFVVNSNKSMKL